MIYLEWSTPAFHWLESAPQETSFEIFKRIDALTRFPEMGSPMELQFPQFKGYRQLIINGRYRVVYKFSRDESVILIFIIMLCQQKLPPVNKLRRMFRP